MWYDGLFAQMEQEADPIQGEKMAAYMQNHFPFLGLPKPKLSALLRPYLQAGRKLPLDWAFLFLCWEKPYREAQYAALTYLGRHEKELQLADLPKLRRLITEKSWWETVDTLDGMVGLLVQQHPQLKQTMLEWSLSDSIWLRRVAIDFQQRYQEATDTELLAQIVCNNLGSDEFFINKAIGWSLREYSKVNKAWVQAFLNDHADTLSSLSRREASKYL